MLTNPREILRMDVINKTINSKNKKIAKKPNKIIFSNKLLLVKKHF